MSDDEYPSVRKALFGDDHAANLYCGIKWTFWQATHLVLLVLGVAIVAVAVPLFIIYRGVAWVAKKIGQWLAAHFGPYVLEAADRTGTSVSTLSRESKTKPVTRRVYGYCPVDVKMDPKWFANLGDLCKRVYEWAEPPETVWVCAGCGEVRDWRHEPLRCWNCRDPDTGEPDPDWVKVKESNVPSVHPDAEIPGGDQ